jgi:FeS assembly SUF system protein
MKHVVPVDTILGLPQQEKPADTPLPEPVNRPPADLQSKLELEEKIVDILRSCYDPEIPVDIYELGLIYDIYIDNDRNAVITMTLTAPACPVAGTMPGDVENRVRSIPELNSVKVELTFDPPWDKSRMSEAARFQLGML